MPCRFGWLAIRIYDDRLSIGINVGSNTNVRQSREEERLTTWEMYFISRGGELCKQLPKASAGKYVANYLGKMEAASDLGCTRGRS